MERLYDSPKDFHDVRCAPTGFTKDRTKDPNSCEAQLASPNGASPNSEANRTVPDQDAKSILRRIPGEGTFGKLQKTVGGLHQRKPMDGEESSFSASFDEYINRQEDGLAASQGS